MGAPPGFFVLNDEIPFLWEFLPRFGEIERPGEDRVISTEQKSWI